MRSSLEEDIGEKLSEEEKIRSTVTSSISTISTLTIAIIAAFSKSVRTSTGSLLTDQNSSANSADYSRYL